MAKVVLLKGVNVGGHRRVRPARVARALAHLDVTSIGTAGTFVVRVPAGAAKLRTEFARVLPVAAEVIVVEGADLLRATGRVPLAGVRAPADAIRFVAVLARHPRAGRRVPRRFPADGPWCVKVVARRGRFLFGVHRREMRAIVQLVALERAVGVPMTVRGAATIEAVREVFEALD